MGVFDGTKILEERKSKFNGKVTVVSSFAWGKYIQVDGLTQSGGVVTGVWKSTLKYLKKKRSDVGRVLILGLGGGSVAVLIDKIFDYLNITGVDIDLAMVELGRKYLGLDRIDVKTEICDAESFLKNHKTIYDLIIVDTYQGDKFPEKFTSDKFLKEIRKHLNKEGVAIFNRLYFDEKRKIAQKFGEKLQTVFTKVEYFFPEANLMFICS